MSSKLVNRGTMGLAAVIGEIIRKGRPIPTVIGFLLGTAIGASTAFVSMYLFGPASLTLVSGDGMMFFPKSELRLIALRRHTCRGKRSGHLSAT